MLDFLNQENEAKSQLDANLAKQFAWLLREDLRNIFETLDNPAYADWWLIKGRQEYPAWAHATPIQKLQHLFESAGNTKIAGVSVDVPKVVQQLAQYRGDIVKEYTRNGKLDYEKFFAWAMVVGLAEHHLAAYAPRHIVAMLDQTVPTSHATHNEEATAPAPTLLMYLLWRLMDDPIQQSRNIFTNEGRLAYLAWFFSVVGQLNIGPLVAGRWKSWIKSQPYYKGQQMALDKVNSTITAPSSPKWKAEKPFGVNLYGFAYGELGIGEDLRMAVSCCEAANIPYHVVNVDAGNIRQADNLLKGKTHELHSKDLPPYRNNIFCMPAFDTASRIFMQKGPSAFEGYHNIGWWPWELSVFPKAWQPHAFKLVNEVWASSTFLEEMYKRSTNIPVNLVPLSVSIDRIKRNSRNYYGLSEDKFLFLYVFDFNSCVARKNPFALVNIFKEAFPRNDKSVELIIKTMNVDQKNQEWLLFTDICKSDNRVTLITETMNKPDLLGLIGICDAYVSLHRSEGFGRTIAEALLLNKKVVCTNYSGNKDFTNESNSYIVNVSMKLVEEKEYPWIAGNDKCEWAEVDKKDAINKLIYVRKNKEKKEYKEIISTLSPVNSKLKNFVK
jgi:glycosyltransferase involved in cell wall biosynthesis